MKTIIVQIQYNEAAIEQSTITDMLNEVFHNWALEEDFEPDQDTGGYLDFDWGYTTPDGELLP